MKSIMERVGVALLLSCSALAASCSGLADPKPTEGQGAAVSVTLEQPFILGFGQQASVKPDGLAIEFVKLLSESRCPEGAACVWPGEATIQLQVSDVTSLARALELSTQDKKPRRIGDYTVELVDLEPHPALLARPLNPADYRATLLVKRVKE